jgi:hypothetical protein
MKHLNICSERMDVDRLMHSDCSLFNLQALHLVVVDNFINLFKVAVLACGHVLTTPPASEFFLPSV